MFIVTQGFAVVDSRNQTTFKTTQERIARLWESWGYRITTAPIVIGNTEEPGIINFAGLTVEDIRVMLGNGGCND